jgi:predicted ATP-dependent endonuclease of OLD family
MWRRRPQLFRELCEVLHELGLVRDINVEIYKSEASSKSGEPTSSDVAAVLFDGTNLGFCSDGTLRIARIVLELINPDVSCLLIEEPETAVHPGLLDKLLALVEAYSADRQIVLSTHSPQVVDRFAPDQLRLVEREEGVTRVHSLSAADRDLAISYLRDQGSLSDFVFRRSDG